jgi:hypothetical protein
MRPGETVSPVNFTEPQLHIFLLPSLEPKYSKLETNIALCVEHISF